MKNILKSIAIIALLFIASGSANAQKHNFELIKNNNIFNSILKELSLFYVDSIDAEKIITLVPGSRMSEVKRLLPLMRDIVDMMHRNGYIGYKFVIPVVETTSEYIALEVAKWPVKPILIPAEQRYDIYSKTYIAIVASGTVSAELAMMHVPTIVVYKMNPITTWIGRRLIKVKWVSLVNILLNHGIYPEFLGGDAVPEKVMNE